MVRRDELADKQFSLIAGLMPAPGKRGERWNDRRTTLDGTFWWLHPGAQTRPPAGDPARKDQRISPLFERAPYWRSNVAERCVGGRKENRQLSTRRFKLAIIQRCLRLLPDPSEGTWL